MINNEIQQNSIKHGTVVQEEPLIIKGLNATLLGADKVIFGLHTDEDEVVTDELTGFKYIANKVESKVIYDRSKVKHKSPWIAIDLETGTRGYYPGIELFYNNPNPAEYDIGNFVKSMGYTNSSVWYTLTVVNMDSMSMFHNWHCYSPNIYNLIIKYYPGYIIKRDSDYYRCIKETNPPEMFNIENWLKIDLAIVQETFDSTKCYNSGDIVKYRAKESDNFQCCEALFNLTQPAKIDDETKWLKVDTPLVIWHDDNLREVPT